MERHKGEDIGFEELGWVFQHKNSTRPAKGLKMRRVPTLKTSLILPIYLFTQTNPNYLKFWPFDIHFNL